MQTRKRTFTRMLSGKEKMYPALCPATWRSPQQIFASFSNGNFFSHLCQFPEPQGLVNKVPPIIRQDQAQGCMRNMQKSMGQNRTHPSTLKEFFYVVANLPLFLTFEMSSKPPVTVERETIKLFLKIVERKTLETTKLSA